MTRTLYFRYARLDMQIAQFEKEQRDKLRVWSQKAESLDVWLVKNEATVQSYEPIGYDIGYVREQKEDAEVCINKIKRGKVLTYNWFIKCKGVINGGKLIGA